MEVGLVLDVSDPVDELKLHFVVDVELFFALTNLHLLVIVGLLDLRNVHLLQLVEVSIFLLTLVIC
jgi:hypothetical protein